MPNLFFSYQLPHALTGFSLKNGISSHVFSIGASQFMCI